MEGGQDNIVDIATGYGLGFRVSEGARFSSSPRRPDRFWGPAIPLSNK
jgi:hypothetical protein